MGPLGLGSPRVRAEVIPCPAVLCVATTASVRPGRYAFGSLPVPWVDALLFVFRSACAVFGSHDGRVGLHTPGCCSSRSPCFRLCLPKKREALPSSRITLLPTCPALRPRWCPARLPWREQDCCLPVHANRRLSARFPGPILLSTTIQFSEFNLAACVLASPLLRTPHFCDRTSVRLPTWWLTVGRVGLDGFRDLTHWVTLMSFKGNHPYSLVPDLSRHEQGFVMTGANGLGRSLKSNSICQLLRRAPKLQRRPSKGANRSQLRAQTTMTLAWIARALNMGAAGSLANRLRKTP